MMHQHAGSDRPSPAAGPSRSGDRFADPVDFGPAAVAFPDLAFLAYGHPRMEGSALMAEWIYVLHAPWKNFADTTTDEEQAVGLAVIDADDEAAARTPMEEDPAIASGIAKGELLPFRVSSLRMHQ